MKKLRKALLKQYEVPGLGALVDSVFTSLPILSFINIASVLIILYETLKPYRESYLEWLTFSKFISFLGIIFIICLILVYKFLLKSLWSFRGRQMQTLESIETRVANLESRSKESK
jgi:hypothetical protein